MDKLKIEQKCMDKLKKEQKRIDKLKTKQKRMDKLKTEQKHMDKLKTAWNDPKQHGMTQNSMDRPKTAKAIIKITHSDPTLSLSPEIFPWPPKMGQWSNFDHPAKNTHFRCHGCGIHSVLSINILCLFTSRWYY